MYVASSYWQAVAKYTAPLAMLLQQAKAADNHQKIVLHILFPKNLLQ